MVIIVMMRPPRWDPSNQHSATRTPFLAVFLFSFFLFFSFFVFPLPFVVLRVPLPCSFFVRFVLSFCRFPFDSSSLFFSLPCFPSRRILLLCYFVSALHPPPRSWRAWSMRIPRGCWLLSSFLRSWCWFILFFLLFLPFFRFRFGHRLFHPVFSLWVLCCLLGFGFCCDSFSV